MVQSRSWLRDVGECPDPNSRERRQRLPSWFIVDSVPSDELSYLPHKVGNRVPRAYPIPFHSAEKALSWTTPASYTGGINRTPPINIRAGTGLSPWGFLLACLFKEEHHLTALIHQ